MKKIQILFLSLLIVLLSVLPAAAATGIYGATCRTGAAACIDGIDVTDPKGDSSNIGLAVGDIALAVMDAGTNEPEIYVYRLYNTGATESDPLIIKPDYTAGGAYNGTLRWYLVKLVGAGISSSAVDGSNRLDITRNSSRTPATGRLELYPEGTSAEARWKMSNLISSTATESTIVGNDTTDTLTNKTLTTPYITMQEVDGHATVTLTAAQVSGTEVYNTGQGASDVTLTLPSAVKGLSAVFTVGTTVAANKWRVRAASGDKIYRYGIDGTVTAGSDNGYVGYSATAKYPTIGHSFSCYTFKTDNYDWICKPLTNIDLTSE